MTKFVLPTSELGRIATPEETRAAVLEMCAERDLATARHIAKRRGTNPPTKAQVLEHLRTKPDIELHFSPARGRGDMDKPGTVVTLDYVTRTLPDFFERCAAHLPDLQRRFEEFAAREENRETSELQVCADFMEELTGHEPEDSSRAPVRLWYSYNDETDLESDIHCNVVSLDRGDDPKYELWAVCVHNGEDARDGFNLPVFFRVDAWMAAYMLRGAYVISAGPWEWFREYREPDDGTPDFDAQEFVVNDAGAVCCNVGGALHPVRVETYE